MSLSKNAIAGVLVLGGNYGSLAAIRSLGRLGVPVVFLGDPLTVAARSRYQSHFEPWAGVSEADPVGRLLNCVRQHGLENWVLLPGADFEVQLISEHRTALSPSLKLLTMDWPVLGRLNDKRWLYALAEQEGIDFPRVHAAMAHPDDLTYPVVLKPSSTQLPNALTRDKAWRADSAAEFADKRDLALGLAGPDGFVVQQLIPGDGWRQYSYAGLWDRGREICHLTALRLRQFPNQFGTSPYVLSQDLPRAAEEARRLLSAVGYHGLVEVEFKHDMRDDRLKLLDVNTRIWAWIGLGEACGVDFPALAAQLATGLAPQHTGATRHGPAWRRAIPNLLSLLDGVARQGSPGPVPVRSTLGPAHPAVFAGDDMLPALSEIPIQVIRKAKGALGL